MEMTTHEIVRMYKDAADKKKQITILAQMNLCTPEEIRDELIKGGIDARTLPRKRKKPGEKVAETTAVPETTPATKAEPKDTEQALPVFIQREDVALVHVALAHYYDELNQNAKDLRAQAREIDNKSCDVWRILNEIDAQTEEATHDPLPR